MRQHIHFLKLSDKLMYSHVVPLNPLRNVNPESLAKLYRPKEDPSVIETKETKNIAETDSTAQTIQIRIRKPKEQSHSKMLSFSGSESRKGSGFIDPDDFFIEVQEDEEGEEPYKKRKIDTENVIIDTEKASMKMIDELDINLLEKSTMNNCLILNEFDTELNFSGKEICQNLNQNFSKKTYFNFSSKTETSNLNYTSPESVFEFSDKQSISNDANSVTQIETHISIVSTKVTTKTQRKSSSAKGPTHNQLRLQECLKEIKETDLQRLEPGIYLNDNIINFYMKVVQYGFLSDNRRRQCHFFNTYFMSCMRQFFTEAGNDLSKFDSVYEKMEKWTKKINILEKDFVFIPLHEDQHWSLIILCYPNRLLSQEGQMPYVIFMNSLSRTNEIYASILFEFLSRELQVKKPNEYQIFKARTTNSGVSSLMYYQHMVPKQSNMTDCGLYLLQYIEIFAEDEKFILNNKENLNKIKWFPKTIIQEKRQSIKKIIEELMSNKFKTLNQYITSRNKTMKEAKKNPEEYNSFNKLAFEEAFGRAYGNVDMPPNEKIGLMLDFYFSGSLDLRR